MSYIEDEKGLKKKWGIRLYLLHVEEEEGHVNLFYCMEFSCIH